MSDFVGPFIDAFNENVKQEADKQITDQVDHYKNRVSETQQNASELLSALSEEHTKAQKQMADKMEKMIDNSVAMLDKALRARIDSVPDDLFTDPKELHNRIKAKIQEIETTQARFAEEKQQWIQDDERIAKWLGRPWKSLQNTQDFDEKAHNYFSSDLQFITIKVDDRIFRTYRKTMAQVSDSKIAQLFRGTLEDKNLLEFDEKTNVYILNCNPHIFAQILDILRTKQTAHIELTSALVAALDEFGILRHFYPALNVDTLQSQQCGASVSEPASPAYDKEYHVVFRVYRSNALQGKYVRWNVQGVASTEMKSDEKSYWQINAADDSQIDFTEAGWYRITFRACINHSSAAAAYMYINGSIDSRCYHYENGSNTMKSYYFNEIRQLSSGQKLQFHLSKKSMHNETPTTYLCIERIPDAVLPSVGVWKSSTSSSNYRHWNSVVKSSDDYAVKSNYNLAVNRGGLYRVSARVHSNHSSAGNRQMCLYENRNGSNHSYQSYQASNHTNFQCHMFDVICSFKKDDYVSVNDGGYGTVSHARYDCIHMERIACADMVAAWKSSTCVNTNERVWEFEVWCSDRLYALDDNKSKIKVSQAGAYKISCNVTQYQEANQEGYAVLYVNEAQYAKSRVRGCGGTYYYTITIQEIVVLKEGDSFYIYSSHPYNSRDFNSLSIEKLM